MNQGLVYRRLRTPSGHGQALVDPPFSDCKDLLHSNLAWRSTTTRLLDRDLQETGDEARRALAHVVGSDVHSKPIVMSGHQPELFHAGVWFKNFALSTLAEALGAASINVTIDNDLCRTTALRTPTRTEQGIVVQSIEFDETPYELPFEQRRVVNREMFESFGARVESHLDGLVSDPIIVDLWPIILGLLPKTDRISDLFVAARSSLERGFGVSNIEVPLSVLCETDPFRRFLLHLTSDAERFADEHNRALLEYRRVNRVRSKSHPAPPLERVDGWVESPFWIWTEEHATRRRLFARLDGETLSLGDRKGAFITLVNPLKDGEAAIEQLSANHGFRLRPRALATTMFLRLLLSDLFLHGVGGAKYDQLTDELFRSYWGFAAPSYLTLTATACLPIPTPDVDEQSIRQLDSASRKMWFHPDAHLTDAPESVQGLIDEKRALIAERPMKGRGQPRRLRINEINSALRPLLQAQRDALKRERQTMVADLRSRRILSSREFSFCLHSSRTLPPLLLELSQKQP